MEFFLDANIAKWNEFHLIAKLRIAKLRIAILGKQWPVLFCSLNSGCYKQYVSPYVWNRDSILLLPGFKEIILYISISFWKASGQLLRFLYIFHDRKEREYKGLNNLSMLMLGLEMFFNQTFEYGLLCSFDYSKEQMIKWFYHSLKL